VTSLEKIYANLYNLLSQTQQLTDGAPNGQPAFLTTARRLPQVSQVGQAQQPAMYILEGEEIVRGKVRGPGRYMFKSAAVIFFRNTGGPNEVASTQMNALRDAFNYQIEQRTLAADGVTVVPLLGGRQQTLGGVVYDAYVDGTGLRNEGLQNNQGALSFPISILSGM
jgi:hypothetical protein